MVTWIDFGSLFCVSLTILAVASLTTAAQNFVIVKGKVVNTGAALIDGDGGKFETRTVTVVIENNDRVFRIQRGTAVEYAVSDNDAARVETGSEIELLISSHESQARLLNVEGRPGL